MSTLEGQLDPIACPICRSIPSAEPFAAPTGPAREYPLVWCESCELAFQKLPRNEEELDQAHAEAYGKRSRRFSGLIELLIRLFRFSRARLAKRLLPPGGRVLDAGCGRGIFLRRLAESGYRVRGTELSTRTAANVHPDLEVDIGELRPGLYPEGSFDLISIWHVLEHDRAPELVVRASHQALVPGGALLIAVPNFGSPQARLSGEHWFHLDLPRHIFHFTRHSLVRLLTTNGFEIESCRTGQLEMDPFDLLQSGLNRLGLRHNALYDSLRSNPAVRRDLSLPYRLTMLALLPVGLLLTLLPSLLLYASGRAGTLIVVARKPSAPEA
jgi:2-polyprenyl-3-methyl-5-hydroxy-6-metoxy-1,4-benzoquinol methylase